MKNAFAFVRRLLPSAAERDTPATTIARCGTLADAPDISSSGDGLWTGTRPEAMAAAARDLFGTDAVTAAAWCAVLARSDGREADYRLWFKVFMHLGGVADDDRRALLADRH